MWKNLSKTNRILIIVGIVVLIGVIGQALESPEKKEAREQANTERVKGDEVRILLKNKIGPDKLPYEDMKVVEMNGGVATIIGGSWCYFVKDGEVYCVNGTAKSMLKDCKQAPEGIDFASVKKAIGE